MTILRRDGVNGAQRTWTTTAAARAVLAASASLAWACGETGPSAAPVAAPQTSPVASASPEPARSATPPASAPPVRAAAPSASASVTPPPPPPPVYDDEAGGECVAETFKGTCTAGADGTFTFKGEVAGKAVTLKGNTFYGKREAARLPPGKEEACHLKLSKSGTCTPCTLSLGSCGVPALDLHRSRL